MRETIAVMEQTAHLVVQATGKVEKLVRQSERIQEIVAIIQGIAKQTDLLALNASIEAARAEASVGANAFAQPPARSRDFLLPSRQRRLLLSHGTYVLPFHQ